MHKSAYFKFILAVIITTGVFSCKKKTETPPEMPASTTGTSATSGNPGVASNFVSLNFTNVWGSQILRLSAVGPYSASTPKYVNANGDTCAISQCRYYLSNFRLKKSDNTYYTENNSYHLLETMDTTNSCKFNLAGVPVGDYTQIEFLIGVDSTRNCSGAQIGALDVTHGMFWNWSQGYILFQFEGYSNQATPAASSNLVYHLGGFSAPYNNVKKVTLNLTNNLSVVADHISKAYFKADISETFKTPITLNFAVDMNAMTPKLSKKYADNYADMFSLSAIVN